MVTSKRDYSTELNVLDHDSHAQAFVIRYHYPAEVRQQSAAASAERQTQQRERQEKQQIAAAFGQASTPRNWRYTKRVAAGSASIAPDFARDDGRFAYIGFPPSKPCRLFSGWLTDGSRRSRPGQLSRVITL